MGDGLDINTPKGQKTLIEEINMLKYVSKCWDVKIKTTNKKLPVSHDGAIFNEKNEKIAIFESKNRQSTLEEFENWGSWLITFDKLERCRKTAKELKIPFYGFLGIEKSKLVLYWKISDENGNYLFDFERINTTTRANVNGGEAYRENAFLPMKHGKFIQPNQKNIL
jgi:hypothetical protein